MRVLLRCHLNSGKTMLLLVGWTILLLVILSFPIFAQPLQNPLDKTSTDVFQNQDDQTNEINSSVEEAASQPLEDCKRRMQLQAKLMGSLTKKIEKCQEQMKHVPPHGGGESVPPVVTDEETQALLKQLETTITRIDSLMKNR